MSRRLPIEDTQPWYRQFWPWFLIALPASVVVAGLTTLYIANRHADDLVVDEYYKDGLAINRQLEKKQRAEVAGISAKLVFEGKRVTVQVDGPVDVPTLQLYMSHPLEADSDFQVQLDRIAPGYYQGSLQQAIAPRWYWTLEFENAAGWRLDGSVEAADIGNASGN